MGRLIGSVVVGYVVLFVGIMLLMSAAWAALGADRAFQPGSWEITGLWAVTSIVVGFVVAMVGGFVCQAIARDRRGPMWLIGVVVVLGVAFAIPVITGGGDAAATPRMDNPPMGEAMTNAVQPVWVALLNPLLGAVGVWLGARLKGAPAADA